MWAMPGDAEQPHKPWSGEIKVSSFPFTNFAEWTLNQIRFMVSSLEQVPYLTNHSSLSHLCIAYRLGSSKPWNVHTALNKAASHFLIFQLKVRVELIFSYWRSILRSYSLTKGACGAQFLQLKEHFGAHFPQLKEHLEPTFSNSRCIWTSFFPN